MNKMLDALYDVLPSATELPIGRFRGVLPADAGLVVWEGKVFRGERVTNIVLGTAQMVGGKVMLSDGEVIVTYSILPGLVDYLKPAGRGWLGKAVRGDDYFYFVLKPWG